MQAAALDIQEQVYQIDLNRLEQPTDMKLGFLIFALFSVLNIIAPLFLSTIPLSTKLCTIVLYCSIGFLTLRFAMLIGIKFPLVTHIEHIHITVYY